MSRRYREPSLEFIAEHTRSTEGCRIEDRRRLSILTLVVLVAFIVASACTIDQGSQSSPAQVDDGEAVGDTADSDGGDADDDDNDDGDVTEDDSGVGSGDTTTDEPESDDSSGDPSESDVRQLLAELPGQLAIGNGTQLSVGRPDGQVLTELDGSDSVLAAQPTWSHRGDQLVWTSASTEAQVAKVLTFDEDGLPQSEPMESDASGPPIFYYQWSSDDDRLLYLRNSPAGAQVEAGRFTPGEDVVPVAVGSPFFASWALDDRTVAVHRNNFEVGTFDQFAADSDVDDPEVTGPTAGLPRSRSEFTTPAWLGPSELLVVSDGDLVVAEIDSPGLALTVSRTLVSDVGSVRFVVSPDRSKIAFQQPPGGGEEVVEAAVPVQGRRPTLAVFDVATGDVETVTDSLAVAWEWSPDSSRLAWLQADTSGLAKWQFWSTDPTVRGAMAANDRAPVLRLSRKYLNNYLPFFSQYSHSVTGWSPDSTAFATAGSADGIEGIWVQLLDVDVPAVAVAEGDFVTWGGGPTPPASGAVIT